MSILKAVTSLVLVATLLLPNAANAQEGNMLPTSGGSLRVLIKPTWNEDGQAFFRITFYEPERDVIQRHVDFDFAVLGSEGPIYRLQALHTAPGVVIIPHTFKENGSYTVRVSVFGINFLPSNPESVEFPVSVTPEFNASFAIAPLVIGMMLAIRIKNPFAVQKR